MKEEMIFIRLEMSIKATGKKWITVKMLEGNLLII